MQVTPSPENIQVRGSPLNHICSMEAYDIADLDQDAFLKAATDLLVKYYCDPIVDLMLAEDETLHHPLKIQYVVMFQIQFVLSLVPRVCSS